MTLFMFNFLGTNNDQDGKVNEEIQWLESEEIIPSKEINDLTEAIKFAKMFTCGEVEIGYVSNFSSLSENTTNNVELAEKEHSDLVTGKYEGGLKIWECTYDLIKYLEKNQVVDFKNAKVMDLGCGVGILGIYAFIKGASVTFQDYNKEVIESLTIPSILLNIEDDNQENDIQKCKFYCGDWSSFNDKLGNDTYDIILTSETIYNVINYNKLVKLLKSRISDSGVIFVAAKTCYFGVGGGMRQFETAINKEFKSKLVWKTDSGIQREILQINKQNNFINS